MLTNYLRLALRNLAKDKVRTTIEVFGLSVGLACCLLIMHFVRNEFSYDRFHSRAGDIYRAWAKEDHGPDRQFFNSFTPIVLGETLGRTVPGVEAVVRLAPMSDIVSRGDKRFTNSVLLADNGFFQVFNFKLLDGDDKTALEDPHSAVITEDVARRLFGRTDVVGETFSIRFGERFEELKVTAVTARPPANSSIQYEIVVPFTMARNVYPPNAFSSWFEVYVETYVLLDPDVSRTDVEARFPGMLSQAMGDRYASSKYSVGLQPLTDIHLDTSVPSAIAPVSDPAYSYILGGIALLILTIACINYMTLSIGRSTQRAVEVGIRKSIGADRARLMRQFWGEAVVTSLVALVVGIALAEMFRPLFNHLAGTKLDSLLGGETLGLSLALCLTVGLIAGSYPAVVLSHFQPAEVLKGNVRIAGDRSLVRRGLVTIQFALSVFLIAAMLVMARQFSFIRNKPLGFERRNVVALQLAVPQGAERGIGEVIGDGMESAALLESEIKGLPGVISVAAAGHTFGESWTEIGFSDAGGRHYDMQMNVVDEDYLSTMGMTMVAGRAFSRDVPSDRNRAVIVNEALVRAFGITDPVGSRLPGTRFPDHEIIGVVKDFNNESLHGQVRPVALTLNPDLIFAGASDVSMEAFPMPKVFVRIDPANVPVTMKNIEKTWHAVVPDMEYGFTFVDASIDAQYRQEYRLGEIVQIASGLAILIACLGLFGLAGLAVVRRTKEIGVRKVLGASGSRVFWLLSKDFGWIVLVSAFVATPVAFVVMDRWLRDFAYRITLTPDLFLLAGLIVVAVAVLTVTYQGIRAAQMDPVESLRYE